MLYTCSCLPVASKSCREHFWGRQGNSPSIFQSVWLFWTFEHLNITELTHQIPLSGNWRSPILISIERQRLKALELILDLVWHSWYDCLQIIRWKSELFRWSGALQNHFSGPILVIWFWFISIWSSWTREVKDLKLGRWKRWSARSKIFNGLDATDEMRRSIRKGRLREVSGWVGEWVSGVRTRQGRLVQRWTGRVFRASISANDSLLQRFRGIPDRLFSDWESDSEKQRRLKRLVWLFHSGCQESEAGLQSRERYFWSYSFLRPWRSSGGISLICYGWEFTFVFLSHFHPPKPIRLPHFTIWSADLPDLSPTERSWAILKKCVPWMRPPDSRCFER
jgi:hypothetical protein